MPKVWRLPEGCPPAKCRADICLAGMKGMHRSEALWRMKLRVSRNHDPNHLDLVNRRLMGKSGTVNPSLAVVYGIRDIRYGWLKNS